MTPQNQETPGLNNPVVELDVTCMQSIDELVAMEQEWDDFVVGVGSDIYFTVDWLATWWTYYGADRAARLFVVRDNGKIVAVLPFCIDQFWLGIVPFKLGRLAGADSTIVVFSPPIEPGYEGRVMPKVLAHLTGKDICDAVSVSPLSGQCPFSLVAEENVADEPGFELFLRRDSGPHTVVHLHETFDDHIKSLKKSYRRNFRSDERKLVKQFDLVTRIIEGEDAANYFDKFAGLHTAQWTAAGRLGHFGDWGRSAEFNRELVRKMCVKGRAKFFEYAGNGRVLSTQFCLELGAVSFWRLPARDPDPEFQTFGLGRFGFVKMLESLIEEGKSDVEAGPGHYDYKLAAGGTEHQMQCFIYTRDNRLSRLKTHVFLRWADALHFVYYRAWFLKLRPRIQKKAKPMWRPWVRTRI